MKLLLVKTSSMGDVIHALPVVTDLRAQRPDLAIDWVVEEAFADLPALHPGVARVQRIALRRWRRALLRAGTWREIGAARTALRERAYDAVLDLQGLAKSAWVARWAGAPITGFARDCVREPIAARAYAHTHRVDMQSHAIDRLRSLAGQAWGYTPQGLPAFGLRRDLPRPAWMPPQGAVVLLHATSRPEKAWSDDAWVRTAQACAQAGRVPLWPWGSAAEQAQAQRLASLAGTGLVTPRMRLSEAAAMLLHAHGTVGVDTGLMHLSAAFERPTVAIFTATPAWRFGPYWTHAAVSLGGEGASPSADDTLDALWSLGALEGFAGSAVGSTTGSAA